MPTLDGTWIYQSFCPQAANGESPAQLAAPWAPRGELFVTTNTGKVTGKLRFGPDVELTVSGSMTAATPKLPEGIDLVGEGMSATYSIRGFFIDGTAGPASGPTIVGTVLALKNDLGRQPAGTQGPFVLFPTVG